MTLWEMFSLVYQLHMSLTKLKFEELGINLGWVHLKTGAL